jgi:hypothetical protein
MQLVFWCVLEFVCHAFLILRALYIRFATGVCVCVYCQSGCPQKKNWFFL